MRDIQGAERLSHALLHNAMARGSFFKDHETSGLPMRAKDKHFITIFAQTLFQHFSLHLMVRQSMVLPLCIVVELFCSPIRNVVPRFSLHDLP